MSSGPESVAILRFGALGDVVLTTPAVEALRRAWPETRILFVTKEQYAPLVAHNPHINEVVTLGRQEGAWGLAKRLRALDTRAVLDLHGKIRSQVIHTAMPGVPWVTWHKRDLGQTILVKLGGQPARATLPTADRFHLAAEQLAGRSLEKGRLAYFPGPTDRAEAEAILRAAGIDPERPLIGLSPGAQWATKRWPASRYGELATRAMAAGFQVAVQGSDAEKPIAEEVRAVAPAVVDLTGKLSIAALGGFIARCTAFVTNDTGPLHIARGLGVPTLAFFGSTDPAMFDFQGHAVLFAGLPCSPCSFFGRAECPEGHFRCMLDLSVDQAWDALQPLLQGTRVPLLSA